MTLRREMQGHFFLWRRLVVIALRQRFSGYLGFAIAAWAAASRAMGTRKGEQDT